ncbi:unnamed protein product [Urochloa humidicola]
MSLQSQCVIATGLVILLVSASLGVNAGSCGFGLLLCFLGLLTGVNVMAIGVWMADNPSVTVPTFLRRNLAVVGLVVASSAVTAVAGEASPVVCGVFFALLVLGVSTITAGVIALPVEAAEGVVKAA